MLKKYLALMLAFCLILGIAAGCGSQSASSPAPDASASSEAAAPADTQTEDAPAQEDAAPADAETEPAPEAADSAVEPAEEPAEDDFTASNAARDYEPYRQMLYELPGSLPVVEETVPLTYFLGFESNTLAYLPEGDLMNHQVWSYLKENSGIDLQLTVVDSWTMSEKLNLMLASGDYTDLLNLASYTAGVEAAYDEDIIIDLGDDLEADMPNYWKIIHSDQTLLGEVQDGEKFLAIYAIKDQVANPTGMGPFIRRDWLEDLDLEVPQTYDELTEVLRAFKTEKGASEPIAMQNTVSLNNGVLMAGFGSLAELSANNPSLNVLNAFYQEDGEVIYGATTEGTRKYLQWVHSLNEEGLMNFENMQNRDMNPFGELNMNLAADGTNGYIFQMQPFGGNYSVAAANNYGDDKCNWWPVQDVAETAGQTIPFFEEVTLLDAIATALCISSQCENVDAALKFLDYGYSREGSLLYNMGFQKGSGHEVESWDYGPDGEPTFDAEVMSSYGPTNLASGILTTKDLAGVVLEKRLAFEFGERELSCFDAWSTNKNNDNILGAATVLTSEESVDAAAIYSDIITYVGTCALQFINGDLDINDDAVWDKYVSDIENMNIDGLTEIVQTAYDRAH